MRSWILAGSFLATLTLWPASPASARILYTGLTIAEVNEQTGPTTLSPTEAALTFQLNFQSPADFTGATVAYPGAGSPETLAYDPTLGIDGSYYTRTTHFFASISALQAAYPFGIYTFTATNSTTSTTESASLNYDYNHWPSATPSLTPTSYTAAQGMNAGQAYTFSFNSFTGDGNSCCLGQVDPSTTFYIFQGSKTVYESANVPNSTTSFTLPANTLEPGQFYQYYLSFNNLDNKSFGPYAYASSYATQTYGFFTTAVGSGGPRTLANLQGGTPGDPKALPIVGQIGDVTGSIGGQGSTDFYELWWSGGAFQASTSLAGAPNGGSYLFELLDIGGSTIDSVTLDGADGFSGALNDDLTAGFYEVGLDADSPLDPDYSIQFTTPVEGVAPASVPEPATWAMLLVGFGAVGAALRRRVAATRHLHQGPSPR
jgi:hypothetical protein